MNGLTARDLEGRIALVTGGGSGIGEAIARVLDRDGAITVVADRDQAAADRVAGTLKRAVALRLDVTDDAAVAAAIDLIAAQHGALDLAVNNAGIGVRGGRVHEVEPRDWRAVLDINLDGVFHCMRHELRIMSAQRRGAIVNMASVLGLHGFPNSIGYVASKHAVIGMTKAAALEYADRNIRINAICPAFIETPAVARELDGPARSHVESLHPMGRLGQSIEVAEFVAFLLSDRASFVTGSSHLVDGAYAAR